MRYSKCKCGKMESWSSGFCLPCSPCKECGTNADGSEVREHEYTTTMVNTDEGKKPYSVCIWCMKPKYKAVIG